MLRGFEAPTSQWGPGHRGVDLGAPGGSVVSAAGAGTVSFAAVLAGRGVVVVSHPDGQRTTYEPVTASVRVGEHVARGDPLGRLGLAASHCLPRACLHWGALRRSTYLDPLTLLGLAPGPVRLLPLGPGGDTAPDPLPLASWPPEVRPIGGATARSARGGAALRTASGDATDLTASGDAAAPLTSGGSARPASGGAAARAAPDGALVTVATPFGRSVPSTAGLAARLGATGLVDAAGVAAAFGASAAGAAWLRRTRRRAPPERS